MIAMIAAGLLFVGLSIYTIVLDSERDALRIQLSAQNEQAFEELLSNVAELEAKFYKLEAANGLNQRSILLMDVWRQAGETESSIAALPVTYGGTCRLTQFVNRAGDYCRMLTHKLAKGEDLSDDDYAQIQVLAGACRDIYSSLEATWQNGTYPGDAGFGTGIYMLAAGEGSASLDFPEQEFPRLMYNGPFSEATENKAPEGLGGNKLTAQQALQAAAEFLDIETAALVFAGECAGDIPSYIFKGEKQNIPFSILITKQGGHVLWYMSSHDGGISAIPTDEKYERLSGAAQRFLRTKGYGASAPSYAQFYNGLAIINLIPQEQGIVLYPDMIKLWLDIPTGKVVGFDANNYLMSHKKRSFEQIALNRKQAEEKINGGVEVQSARLALIPLESGKEQLCWEFTGTMNDHDYLIYINVKTGIEEDIMMIQHINDGTLIM